MSSHNTLLRLLGTTEDEEDHEKEKEIFVSKISSAQMCLQADYEALKI